jgi:limonene 1,2-monooxygenase
MLNLKFGLIVTPTNNEQRHGDPESQENWVLPNFSLLDYEALWFAGSFLMPTTGESAVNPRVRDLVNAIIRQAQPSNIGLGILPPLGEDIRSGVEQLLSQPQQRQVTDKPAAIALAAQVSPESVQIAGIHDYGLLSIGATTPAGFGALPSHWEIYARKAKENGRKAQRDKWALVAPMHLAETREQAMHQVLAGIDQYGPLYAEMGITPSLLSREALIETLIENHFAVVGTPDDAIDQINRLLAQTGGFGKLLLPANHWANARDTLQSYALFSRTVIAHFKATGPSSQ